jgi:hypothetical protein
MGNTIPNCECVSNVPCNNKSSTQAPGVSGKPTNVKPLTTKNTFHRGTWNYGSSFTCPVES